ncbi:MAG: hypothetical protein KAT56_10375, partial [Sedimentisphaerales bacterium]|nr:hypothetical protein [Sedimentisphaerales bacterium]
MKVNPKHIGHIAPSFDDPKIYNSFVIKPAYRISLRMSEVEKLFPWPIDSAPGRLARLQVLGL